jgi:hypothetical protein
MGEDICEVQSADNAKSTSNNHMSSHANGKANNEEHLLLDQQKASTVSPTKSGKFEFLNYSYIFK